MSIISNKPDLISALSVSYLTMFNYTTTCNFPLALCWRFCVFRVFFYTHCWIGISCLTPHIIQKLLWSLNRYISSSSFGGFFPLLYLIYEFPLCGNSCSVSGDNHLRSMLLPQHVCSPTCKPPTLFSEYQDIELSSFLSQCIHSQYFSPRSPPFAVLPERFLLLSHALSDKHWNHSGGSSTVHLPCLETAWAHHVPHCSVGREGCHPPLGLRTGRNPSENKHF